MIEMTLQTQDSKFDPWWSEAEHATSRSRRLPAILTFTRGWGRNIFSFFQTAETGNRTPNSGVKGSGANHYPRAPARHTKHAEWKELAKCCSGIPHGLFWSGSLLYLGEVRVRIIDGKVVGGSMANHYPGAPARQLAE